MKHRLHAFYEKTEHLEDSGLADQLNAIVSHSKGLELIRFIFEYSPFLSRIILQSPAFFAKCCIQGIDACFSSLKNELEVSEITSTPSLMRELRVAKAHISLLTALGDISNSWPLERITATLSEFAELTVRMTLRFLLRQLHTKNEISLSDQDNPEEQCGLFVLAMGKLGGRELNYSSDIDLIVFFDNERVHYTGSRNAQDCFSKLTHEMVRILQERTADGYVFRVDLRLRPDPASTPAAMSTTGAITYYETVGQNWERAAFIKARPIAGDFEAGYLFLRQIAPFLWRKHLDFAAIDDIQSIKRQMDDQHSPAIALPGHNIKTGLGGIREIEFFAQIHQLIWGGRINAVRQAGTCQTLQSLASEKLITEKIKDKLIKSYYFFRTIEHRLQMVDDQQTHIIPVALEARHKLAGFLGVADYETFEKHLLKDLNFVHKTFTGSFKGTHTLGSEQGKLSFTGVESDPQTMETITKMGFANARIVSEIIQGWHRGSRRATRTKRARELITELTPTLLQALAGASDPDQAFIHFDEFLSRLPAGVQLFSLFAANPQLLDLIALIMGAAPAMAASLSKNPNLLDTVLTAEFFRDFANYKQLFLELSTLLIPARDFEDEINIIRRFKNEKEFQAGVQLIRHQVSPHEAGHFLSDIAEACLQAMLHRVEIEFSRKFPELEINSLAIIALGRLGKRELTFGSDIDLLFIYDNPSHDSSLAVTHNAYNKLSQRFITAVTALTAEGKLYDVDTRLRPSGKDGALAVSADALDKYLNESAWTFELMALSNGRILTGKEELQEKLEAVLVSNLCKKRESAKLKQDITELRSRITKEFGSYNPWQLKYVHGGLIDQDFLAQYLVLLHAQDYPSIITHSPAMAFAVAIDQGFIDKNDGEVLIAAHIFLNALFALLRLCGGKVLDETSAPTGLKNLIATRLGFKTFEEVKATLISMLATSKKIFDRVIAIG